MSRINWAPVAIAVERAIAREEAKHLQEDAAQWAKQYGAMVAYSLVAAEAAAWAARLHFNIERCERAYR